jgi:hypothetical protein
MKKILIGLGVVVVLFVGALLVIPMFYSIDQFRPQIKTEIEKSVKADVTLGKLSFKLFPKIVVSIDGLKVQPKNKPFNEKPILELAKFELQLPLTALLVAPSMSIVLDSPVVLVDQNGADSNITSILLEQKAVSSQVSSGTPDKSQASGPPPAVGEILKTLPGFVSDKILKAKMNFSLTNATIEVVDRKAPKGSKTQINKFDFILKDIGLTTPMDILIKGVTDVAQAGAVVSGPFEIKGSVTFEPVDSNHQIKLKITKDLSGLDIRYAPFFHKKSGTPFAAVADGMIIQNANSANIKMEKLGLKFANVDVSGEFQGDFPLMNPTQGKFKTGFNVKDFDLAAWGALVPMVRDFALGGKVNVALSAEGVVANPSIDLGIGFKGITGSTPELKKPISDLQGNLTIKGGADNPKVSLNPFSMKIGSSDLSMTLSTEGLKQIGIQVSVKSNKWDVDELLGLEALNLEKSAASAASAPPASNAPSAEEAARIAALPLDEALTSMAPMVEEQLKNPMLDQLKAKIQVEFKSLKALGAEFKNIKTLMTYANRKLQMADTGMEAYKGKLVAGMNLDMTQPEEFGFQMDAKMVGVDFGQILAIHAPSWKSDMGGSMNGTFSISGKGLRKEQLDKNLAGGLNGEIKNGRLSLPVVKVVNMAMDELPKLKFLGSKIPERNKNQQAKGEFKTCFLNTRIKGRSVVIESLDVVYDTEGAGLGDLEFKSNGTADFDQNIEVLGTAFMSPDVVRIPELKGPSGKIEIPLKMKGKMSAPETDTNYTLKILGERIAQNLLKSKVAEKAKAELEAVKAKAEAEAKKAAEAAAKKAAEEALKKAPEPLKKGIEDLKKKFKF